MLKRYVEIVCILVLMAALQPCYMTHRFQRTSEIAESMVGLKVLLNLLKTKRNLLYIRNQTVPHIKRFPTLLQKPIS